MRVISGKYKGRKLEGFDIDGTRPTMDRVKESLFAMINYYLDDSNCLDLFAGSGALGIEALSNGAKKVTFVDNATKAINVLNKNLHDICGYEIIKDDAIKYLNSTSCKFDIIFLDPPYQKHLINDVVKIILKRKLLNKEGIIVCEYTDEVLDIYLPVIKEKKYGDKYIRIYQNN